MVIAALLLCSQASSKEELVHLAERLEKLQRVSFEYRRLLDYGSNGYKHELSAKVYAEFDPKWKPLGVRYQILSDTTYEILNGVAYLARAKGRDLVKFDSPTAESFDSISTMKNSIFGLAASLRAVAKADGIAIDFTKDKFTFEWKGKELAVSRPFRPVEYWPTYEITVDSKLGLPTKIVQRLKDKKDTITTEFKSYSLNPEGPTEASWRY